MGFYRGPGIVRDSLILYLDAANSKSFRGESTTNVVANPLPTSGWNAANFGGSSITRTFLSENGKSYMRFSNVINASDYPRVVDSVFTSNITGTFSTSFEVRGTPGAQLKFRIYENGSTKITNLVTITSEWVRYKFEAQTTAFSLNQPYFNPLTTGAIYDIKNIQVESKSYSTPFVDGTRGGSISTGGGLIDLSKNGNNGELISGVTYNSANNGSLVFDGTTGYVTIPNNENIVFNDNNFSVGFWIKTPITSIGEGSPSQWGPIISKGCTTSAPAGSWWIAQNSSANNRITLNISSTTGGTFVTALTTGVLADGWHHIAATRSGSTAYLYTDGSLSFSDITSSSNLTNTSPLTICTTYNSIKRTGTSISNIKLYNKALSSSEILQNYNATKSRFGL